MQPKRLLDAEVCKQVTDKYPDYFTFDTDEWFSDVRNHAYVSEDNIGFAEWKSPGAYWVHFCFNSARGKEAIDLTKAMVEVLYKDTQFQSVVGLIAEDNRKARWLIRQVGFTSLGMIDTKNGLCEMFYLTKKKGLHGGL